MKEALLLAKTTYKNWFNENKDKIIEDKIRPNMENDVATPFFKVRVRKYEMKGKSGSSNQGVRERSRYNNYISKFFKDIDYTNPELIGNAIDDLVNHLREDKKTDNTISKYLSMISLMFKRAHRLGVIKFLPEMPSLQVINRPRQSYFNDELNLINKKLVEEFKKTEDEFYLEVKDYLNLIRSAGFRPGLQPLMIKNFQYQFLQNSDNLQEPILQFTLFNTKTSPKHKLTCHPYFTKNIFPEIVNRNYTKSSEDYLLFPNEKNRQSIYNKIGKIFTRISKELNLYYRNGQSRPIYSIRHTFITARYNSGTPLEIIARSSNTSSKMIQRNYLDSEDTMMIEEHKRLFSVSSKIPLKTKE